MGKRENPDQWHTAEEWDSGLQHFGAEIVRQSGSHRIYKFGQFLFLVAVHPGQIPNPICRKLVKTMRLAGMISVLLWAFWPNLAPFVKLVGL